MKKLLIASTALVATAGYASADVSLSGSANAGVRYNSAATFAGGNSTVVHSEVNFGITGTTTTDGGLTVTGKIGLESTNGGDAAGTGDSVLSIGHSGLTLSFGDVSEAGEFGAADVGFDGTAVDAAFEGLETIVAHNVNLTYKMGAFEAAVSADVNDSTAAGTAGAFGIGVKYSDNGLTFGLGYQDFGATGSQTSVMAGYTMGALGLSAGYIAQGSGLTGNGWTVSGTYAIDPATSIAIVAADTNTTQLDIGAGATYNLGGGVSLAGGVASINGGARTEADFGVKITF